MYDSLLKKEKKIAVIGLGYVGLPLALEFAKYFSVVGFDINQKRVDLMNQGIDPSNELDGSAFQNKDILPLFSASFQSLPAPVSGSPARHFPLSLFILFSFVRRSDVR